MKKGFVALLIGLAIIILLSPGIVGRLAEQSMDENLDWAATESQEVVVTSQGFDRGWFSSEGQHRIELREGELRNTFLALVGDIDSRELPVLIIDTRLDHGLVPLSSMSRDKGTLVPGLGSAVSTLRLEFESGDQIDVPGTIYSEVGLTGNLRSNYVLGTGSFDLHGETANWGDTDIIVTTNPGNGNIRFRGSIDSLSLTSSLEEVDVGKIVFSANQQQSRFGFAVGDLGLDIQSIDIAGAAEPVSFGRFNLGIKSALDGDRASLQMSVRLDDMPFADLGSAGIAMDVKLIDVDGAAVGNITDALDEMQGGGSQDDFMFVVQDDLQRLLAAGFELHFDRLDASLPQGPVTSNMHISVAESDPDSLVWTSALLATDATIELSLPAELVDLMISIDPQFRAAIAMGYLKKNGGFYEMEAAFQKGLLTVNGAPIPLPFPGLQ